MTSYAETKHTLSVSWTRDSNFTHCKYTRQCSDLILFPESFYLQYLLMIIELHFENKKGR